MSARGVVQYIGAPPEVLSLRLGQNKIDFDTQVVFTKSFGFPGNYEIEGDKKKDICNADRNLEKRKGRLFILKGAKVSVSGQWVGQLGPSSATIFEIRNDNNLVVLSNSSRTPAFIAENSPMTIMPNPYYWMAKDHLKRELSSGGAKPILVVSGKECPAGFQPWENAKGRFLLGAGKGPLDQNRHRIYEDTGGQYPRVGVLGGEVKHTLTGEEMPSHFHKSINFVEAPKGAALFGRPQVGDHFKKKIDKSTGKSGGASPHNNIPPYIAVNFCEPKSE